MVLIGEARPRNEHLCTDPLGGRVDKGRAEGRDGRGGREDVCPSDKGDLFEQKVCLGDYC